MTNSVVRSLSAVHAPFTLPAPRVVVELLGVAPRIPVTVTPMAPHLGAVGAQRWCALWRRHWGEAREVPAEVDTSPGWGGASDEAHATHEAHCADLTDAAQRLDTIAVGSDCFVRIPRAGEARDAALWASARVVGVEITLHVERRAWEASAWESVSTLRGATALSRAAGAVRALTVPGQWHAQVRCTAEVGGVLLDRHGCSVVGWAGNCARVVWPVRGLEILAVQP